MATSLNFWSRRPNQTEEDGRKVLRALIQAARQPGFYGPGRVADTLEGRLELIHLHGALALARLKAEPSLEPLAQDVVDRLFRHLDSGLREAGVGDTSVPKRMRKIAGDFYGRAEAYAAGMAAGALAPALGRNMLGAQDAPFAQALASYAAEAAARLNAAPASALFESSTWPAAPG
ncbi:MAG: ubiquinol-cytochrome C chaperone family protein [Hyphomonadaceae bacterium]|nr:ubiquinol-cytochrome C chaperone family protein [Hyphomonadaceae bacterium]